MKAKKPPPFALESDLCAAFIAAVSDEWVSYAESAGWDILLSRKADGCQIGIQAKLKLNPDVLNQATESHHYHSQQPGPDYRAVLVPEGGTGGLYKLAAYCGITVIWMRDPSCGLDFRYNYRFHPYLPSLKHDIYSAEDWHEMLPEKRHELPEYIPDVAAGAPSPLQLTKWKIAALKLAILLDQTGYLTRADFRHHKIDIRRWLSGGWLAVGDNGFVRGHYWPGFQRQHPRVWEEILADPKKWTRSSYQLL